MTKEEAIELLKFHSGSHDDINNIKWEKGFLGMLRPFTGELHEDNYKEIMLIIDTLKDPLQNNLIERDMISDLIGICYFARLWGIDEDGMLRRNKLITNEQVALLTTWVDNIMEHLVYTLYGMQVDEQK